jgi:FkbM family methyltransferase
MSIIKTALNYKKAYSNWLEIIYKLYKFRNIKDTYNIKITAKLRDTKAILNLQSSLIYGYANAISKLPLRIHNLSIDKNLLCFSFNDYDLKFENSNTGDIASTFFEEEYSFLNVEGKNVVDIGANIGDTAIYFSIKGAKKVISLEPYPYTFDTAKLNVILSSFKEKIFLVNAGYGKDGRIKIDTNFTPTIGSDIKESLDGAGVEIYSLDTIMTKYNIDSGILKIDCEGCEYNLLDEKNETLSRFQMIQIEYHYGYEKLVDKLKMCGFKTTYTKPTKSYNNSAGKTMMIGHIYAER